ncbi:MULTISPECIES: Bax inhibitor-1/YccA family protein [Enterococcus]|uniref:Bax inhibitor-1/YccA family protein n=1 Tax=Enterococcus TaxID=1350 RepID=UPI0010F7E78B|nr:MULTISPECIES: Bax inhibitor-1/YccA family protein [Enterococcus]KAF1304702.1 hypothetical protein BAU16_00590 [Enterococcus sp. JM9B]
MNNMNHSVAEASGLNRFYSKVYLFFAAGLGLSSVASYLCSTVFQYETLNFVNNFPLGFMGLWIIQMILVVVLGRKAKKNPSLTIAGYIVFSLLMGITLSITLMTYNVGTIVQAFAAAAVTFTGAALIGIFIKKDLSVVGRVAIIGVWGIIGVSLMNGFFFHSAGADFLLSIMTVIIFAGLTAYDNQMIRRFYSETQGENTGVAAFVALQLYLDFMNMFLALVRIFGRND